MSKITKKGLGKGLSALFGDIEKKSGTNQNQMNKVSIADLQRNKFQPRTIFDEQKLVELSLSIKENDLMILFALYCLAEIHVKGDLIILW